MIFDQPPLFNSAWQFEHQGAQRCTTVKSGDLIASTTLCSVCDAARVEAFARSTAKIDNPEIIGAREDFRSRKIDML